MSSAFRSMSRAGLAMVTVAFVTAPSIASAKDAPARPLVFLTRDECVNTTTMRDRLDRALDRLKLRKDYAVIDAETLVPGDARRGYGTPTVLYDSRDLFGMPEPTPPVPSPT